MTVFVLGVLIGFSLGLAAAVFVMREYVGRQSFRARAWDERGVEWVLAWRRE